MGETTQLGPTSHWTNVTGCRKRHDGNNINNPTAQIGKILPVNSTHGARISSSPLAFRSRRTTRSAALNHLEAPVSKKTRNRWRTIIRDGHQDRHRGHGASSLGPPAPSIRPNGTTGDADAFGYSRLCKPLILHQQLQDGTNFTN